MGAFGGRSDFYMGRYPLFLDYSFNFAVKNLRHGTFGRVSDVDNILEVKSSELFASVAGGLPLTRRSMLSLRLNAGHINYHYDSDEQFAYETDHSRFSYAGAKLEVARNTLDKPLYPRKGSHVAASVVFLGGRDKYQPLRPQPLDVAAHARLVRRAAAVGQVISTSPAAAGSRSD